MFGYICFIVFSKCSFHFAFWERITPRCLWLVDKGILLPLNENSMLSMLAIVLSVLRFKDSDYPFGIFKLFLLTKWFSYMDLSVYLNELII